MKVSRLFLISLTFIVMSLMLIACESEIVEVTVEVEKEVIVEVEKEVEVTREVEIVRIEEVEKEVIVTEVVIVEADYEPEGELNIAHGVNHITWDPHADQRTISLQYLNPVFEGLLREATDGKSFIPELATSWEEDEDGITFTLREGVTFHDGEPFDADAVVANFERVVEEGHPVNKGFLKNVESAEALDDTTVRYNFSEFDGTVLLTLARFAGKIISPATFDTVGDNNPVGTGPYVYNADESNPDNTYKVYDYYPDYWNDNAQPVATVEITHITDGAVRMNGLYAGDFHTVGAGNRPSQLQAEVDGYVITGQPAVAWSAHILDRTGSIVPELADERVRLAMNYAIDRTAYWQIVDTGQETYQQALPGGYAYNDELTDLSYDLDKALELMEEAGNPEFTLDLPSFGTFVARNAFLASSWEPLGITVNLVDANNIFAACQQNGGVFPVAVCPINERHIKHFVENRLLESGSLNPFDHRDDEIEELYAEAANLPLAEAEGIYAEIAKISAERGYILHMGWAQSPIVYDPARISGVEARFIYPGTYYIGNVDLND